MMKNRTRYIGYAISAFILTLFLVSVAGAFDREVSPPEAWFGDRSVTISTDNYDVVRLRLVVATPAGIEKLMVKDGDITWYSAGKLNGFYHYEADVLVKDEEGKKHGALLRGTFSIRNGSISVPEKLKEEKVGSLGYGREVGFFTQVLTAVADFFVSPVYADDLKATGGSPWVIWDDTSADVGGDSTDWFLTGYCNTNNPTLGYWRLYDATEGTQTNPIEIVMGDNNDKSFVVDLSGDISLAHERMFIDRSSGAIGFGTTTPEQALHAKTTTSGKVMMRLESTTESTWDIGQDIFGDFSIGIAANGNSGPTGQMLGIDDDTGDVSLADGTLYVDRVNCRLGIGTTTPGGNLHISSAADKDTFAGMGPIIGTPGSGPGFNYGYAGASFGRGAGFFNVRPDSSATGVNPSLRFMTVDNERMIITKDGDVGIGTSDPDSKLHVYGDIRITGGSFIDDGVQVADYVFDDSYKLRPLSELQAYIEKNNHLPGVKSAQEVAEEGLDLGQSQMSLLEKIEELTLYTIQQQKELENKKQQLESLEKRLASIESLLDRMRVQSVK